MNKKLSRLKYTTKEKRKNRLGKIVSTIKWQDRLKKKKARKTSEASRRRNRG